LSGAAAGAAEDLGRCLELGRKIGSEYHRAGFQALHASALLRLGETGPARGLGEAALEEAERTRQAWSRSLALVTLAEARLAGSGPDLTVAEGMIRDAIAIQSAQELRYNLPWSRAVLARILAAQDKTALAQSEYAHVVAEVRAMGMERELLTMLTEGPDRAGIVKS
jgi:ATP/maltotriose-dependent transcriptional regulator MalT